MVANSIKEMTLKSGITFPIGTPAYISTYSPRLALVAIDYNEYKIPFQILHKYYEEFICIQDEHIQDAMYDSGCLSMTGDYVEPDGYDCHGFPSILLALSLI